MLRQTEAQQDYGRRYNGNKSSIRFHRQNNQFFRKPYLEIHPDLEKIEKQLHVGKQKHVFDTIIWALNVKNVKEHRFNLPWTVSALDCRPNIQFVNIGQTVPLYWRMNRSEPNECVPNGQAETPKSEYFGVLGCDYARDILAYKCGVDNITINRDETHQIYFLFTFKDSKFAYVITPIEFTMWYGEREVHYCNVNGAFLFLEIPGEYDYVIRFDWEKHTDVNGKRYKIKLDSWDKIFMSRI